MDAQFKRGEDVFMMNYTPSGADVAVGEVVIVGDEILGIAHSPIVDGELGALAQYGGSYIVTGDAAISAGARVYWDDTAKKVTETASGNMFFGHALEDCSGDDVEFECSHEQLA